MSRDKGRWLKKQEPRKSMIVNPRGEPASDAELVRAVVGGRKKLRADPKNIHEYCRLLFERAASEDSKEALKLLDKAVRVSEDATEAQKESAKRSRDILRKVAMDFWAKAYMDVQNRAANIARGAEDNRITRDFFRNLRHGLK